MCLSHRMRRTALLLSAASAVTLMQSPTLAQEFVGIDETVVFGVSADGSVVVGRESGQAFSWTEAGGRVELGDLPGGAIRSEARSASADGSVIVGYGAGPSGVEAVRWVNGVITSLDANGAGGSEAYSVSADGSVIVGVSFLGNGHSEAFRWTEATGAVGIGHFGGGNTSVALGVSADGQIIVGFGSDLQGIDEAFRFDGTVMTRLGTLPGYERSEAYAADADGSVVIGRAFREPAAVSQAFRWEAGQMQALGFLPGHDHSIANALNSDGTIIVGTSGVISINSGVEEAFYWTPSDGMRSLEDVLAAANIDIGAWQLREALGLSADGSIVIGMGVDPDDERTGWWVRLTASSEPGEPNDPPPPPPPPSGFLSQSVLEQSARSTMVVVSAAFAENNLDVLMRTSRSGARDRIGEMRAWATGAARDYDGDVASADSGEANWLLSYQATRSLGIGGGVRSTSLDGDLPAFAGQAEYEAHALQAFVAYEPAEYGPRVYVGAAFGDGQASVDRGYLNGVTLVQSSGERDIRSVAASSIFGWRLPVGSAQLTPFVRYDAVQVALEEYTETGGPFPAHFHEIDDTTEFTRVGVEARAALSGDLDASGSLAWGHRFDDRLPSITGEIIGLTPFAISGARVERDWTEVSADFVWSAHEGVNVRFGLAASTDGDTAPSLSGFVGVDMRL